jgi:hypothetical protein
LVLVAPTKLFGGALFLADLVDRAMVLVTSQQ